MAAGVEQLLAQAYARPTIGSAAQVYAAANAAALSAYNTAHGTSLDPSSGLEQLVRVVLTQNGKSAQVRESLLETLHAGGAVGESVEECLVHNGTTGWQ